MSYYKTCPLCGAHLDPEEACTCTKKPPPVLPTPKAAKRNNFQTLFHFIIHVERMEVKHEVFWTERRGS